VSPEPENEGEWRKATSKRWKPRPSGLGSSQFGHNLAYTLCSKHKMINVTKVTFGFKYIYGNYHVLMLSENLQPIISQGKPDSASLITTMINGQFF
jgi:hypothetical protein